MISFRATAGIGRSFTIHRIARAGYTSSNYSQKGACHLLNHNPLKFIRVSFKKCIWHESFYIGLIEEKGGRLAFWASELPGIEEVSITAQLGQAMEPLPEGSPSYVGFIFARAESPQDVEAALRKSHRQFEIAITPR